MVRITPSIIVKPGMSRNSRTGCATLAMTEYVVGETSATETARSGSPAAMCSAMKPPMEWPTSRQRA